MRVVYYGLNEGKLCDFTYQEMESYDWGGGSLRTWPGTPSSISRPLPAPGVT